MGKVKTGIGKFRFTAPVVSDFYKIVLVAPHNTINTWIISDTRER
jgi:hypothetical protein